MKKLVSLVLALIMCLGLAACGGNTASTPSAASGSDASGAAQTTPAAPAAQPSAAPASGATYTVGICQLIQHDALDAATRGFRDALTEALGDAVTFDEQNAQGDSATCSTIVGGFVANNCDLIMANATPALQAAVSATNTIPVLGTSVTDYGSALDMELGADGTTGINASGSSDYVPGQLYVDLVLELVPDAKKVSILYCSAEANSVMQSDEFIAAMEATASDVVCSVFTFADSNDIQSVTNAAIADCDALYIPTDNTAASNITIVQNVCVPAGIPIICGEEGMCAGGGLATVSISYYDIGRVCGEQAVQILRDGADVSTMPVAFASNPVKKYNANYAAAIGFTMPEGFEPIQ